MLEESVEVCFDEMLDLFVPGEDPGDAPFAKLFNNIPQVEGREADMYSALVDAINQSDILQGYILTLHGASGDTQPETIDGGMYATERSTTTRNKPADWSTIELSFVCKVDDDPNHEQPSSNEHIIGLEQILSHGTLVFDRQHRTHHYTIVIFGTLTRVIRLDRAGVICSEKFDYTEEPAKLARFLWRFSRLSAIQRGHDPTAFRVLPGTPDYDLMVACAVTRRSTGDYARVLFQESLADDWPWWRITVEDADGLRDFLVGKPTFIASGLVGRGTRGYLALDPCDPDHPIVFLKDCWRILHERTETEGAILSYLNRCGVTGIPTRLCDGDVGGQETVSQDVWKAKRVGEECRLKHYKHYRLVVKEVGIPLHKFETGQQLVFIFIDCLEAHESAYLKAGVIHRDISSGNLLMLPREQDGNTVYEGLLTDWELSERIGYTNEAPRQPDRAGTWQFMSVNALNNPDKPISIPDELESFFHALLWFAIRWLPHNCNDVGKFMLEYFDAGRTENDKEYTCGAVKENAMHSSKGLRANSSTPLRFLRHPPPKPETSEGPSAYLSASSDPSNSGEASASAVKAPKWSKADLHPIDAVFTGLLDWFHAAYQLANHRELEPTIIPAPQEFLNEVQAARFKKFQLLLAQDSQPWSTALDPTLQQTRAALEVRAKKLESHKEMLKFLYSRVRIPNVWPEKGDKLPDQLARNSNPKKALRTSQ